MSSPTDAESFGIETVYQDLALAPDLDAASNVFLGREIGKFGFCTTRPRCAGRPRRASRSSASGWCRTCACRWPRSPVVRSQSVAIARAAMWAKHVILLDEPTAALGVIQTAKVLELIRRVRDRGLAVIFISHNMPQVIEVSDRIEVMRLGARVARFERGEADVDRLIQAISGAYTNEVAGMSDIKNDSTT